MGWSPSLRRLAADRHGISAVEFALILPILMLLIMGIIEVGRYAMLAMRLQHAATTLADLASRDETLTAAGVTNLLGATRHIMAPFDVTASGVAIVTSVGRENDVTRVYWQQRGAGAYNAASTIGAAGGAAILPNGLPLRNGETIIAAEVVFSYQAWLLEIIPDSVLRRAAYYRPRLGTLRSLG